MNLETFTQQVTDIVKEKDDLNYKVKFVFDEGIVHLDGTVRPNVVSHEDAPADTTIKMKVEDAHDFLLGKLNPTMAFMMGKMKVDGSLGVALKMVEMVEK